MLPSMSPEALVHPGGSKTIKIMSFKGLRGVPLGDILYISLLIGLPINPWWIAAY